MSKINVGDTVATMAIKMGEGNPGGLSVVIRLINHKGKSGSDGMLHLLLLDVLEIYGSKLWMLYKDCCGEDFDVLIKTILSFDIKVLTKEQIHEHIKGGKPFNAVGGIV